MQYKLIATSQVVIAFDPVQKVSTVKSVNINLDVQFDEQGQKMGAAMDPTGLTKAMTQALTQGLVANMHAAHQSGEWDSAEHLRYVIRELERGFVLQVNVTKNEKRDTGLAG